MPKLNKSQEDLKDAQAIETFYSTAAGKVIVGVLNKEVNEMMFQFVAELNNPSLNKYISLSCQLKEKLELIKRFTNAGDIRKVIQDSIDTEPVA